MCRATRAEIPRRRKVLEVIRLAHQAEQHCVVVALDQSPTVTGVAVLLSRTMHPVSLCSLSAKRSGASGAFSIIQRPEMLSLIEAKIKEVCRLWDVELVVLEGIHFRRNQRVALQLAQFQGMVVQLLWGMGHRVAIVESQQVCRWLGISPATKREAKKMAALRAAAYRLDGDEFRPLRDAVSSGNVSAAGKILAAAGLSIDAVDAYAIGMSYLSRRAHDV